MSLATLYAFSKLPYTREHVYFVLLSFFVSSCKMVICHANMLTSFRIKISAELCTDFFTLFAQQNALI